MPRFPAVLLVVICAIIAIGGIGYVVAMQLIKLGQEIPSYQQTMTDKIRALKASGASDGIVDRITTTIERLGEEISGEEPALNRSRPCFRLSSAHTCDRAATQAVSARCASSGCRSANQAFGHRGIVIVFRFLFFLIGTTFGTASSSLLARVICERAPKR